MATNNNCSNLCLKVERVIFNAFKKLLVLHTHVVTHASYHAITSAKKMK